MSYLLKALLESRCLSVFSFEEILRRMLARISNAFDKRQGSIIYDTIAPAAAEFAQAEINTAVYTDQTYLLTAAGINLDNRGGDFAIARFQATRAQRIARMYALDLTAAEIAIGSRFATPSESGGVIFAAIRRIDVGLYILECETPGSIGNEYYGDVLPLFIDNRLGRAEITGTEVPARDIETDDDYRERILERLATRAFGGNVADYKRFTREIEGVGDLKVFPIWNGGGTVKLSVIDANYDPITPEFIDVIKETIDPLDGTGLGIGIAPIGHVVTVDTPERVTINIEATVALNNRTIGQIQYEAETNVKEYFRNIRSNWSDEETANIFRARIAAVILIIDRVVNVTNVKLNGQEQDIELIQTAELQKLPFVGTVTLIEP